MNSLISKVNAKVPAVFSAVKAALPMLAVLAVVGVSNLAFAQTGLSIEEIVPEADWTGMITDLGSKLGAVVKAMLGLAVGLLIVGILFRVVRKYASKGA